MKTKINIQPIGSIQSQNELFCIKLDARYAPALTNIEGFSHLQVIWWGNLFDTPDHRAVLVGNKPYKTGPDKLGIFATRSPVRPNPILIDTIFVQQVDAKNGLIYTPYIEAEPGTPVLDIKPYHKCERVRDCAVPDWCSHWPEYYEDSANFNWQNEFNY